MPRDSDLEARPVGVDQAVCDGRECAVVGALPLEHRLQAPEHLAVGGLAEGEPAPGSAQSGAERRRVRPVAGYVADQERDPPVPELDAVVEVAAEVEPLLARAIHRRDVHARVCNRDDGQERLLEPAHESLDLRMRLLLTLEQQLARLPLELQLQQQVVRAPRSADSEPDRDPQPGGAEDEQQHEEGDVPAVLRVARVRDRAVNLGEHLARGHPELVELHLPYGQNAGGCGLPAGRPRGDERDLPVVVAVEPGELRARPGEQRAETRLGRHLARDHVQVLGYPRAAGREGLQGRPVPRDHVPTAPGLLVDGLEHEVLDGALERDRLPRRTSARSSG